MVSNIGDTIGKVIRTLTKIMHLNGDGRSLVRCKQECAHMEREKGVYRQKTSVESRFLSISMWDSFS